MPPLLKVSDNFQLVPSKEYPFASWKFENFNPVQSRIMDFYDKDVNGLISASTSAGKTVIAEQFLAQEIRKRGGKGLFLVPMRALAQEKIDQWTDPNYHFKDLKISICTGDYRITKQRSKELEDADLVIMTSEMLSHRSRNFKSEQSSFLSKVGTLVVDEAHLLTVPGRGNHLEVGLMKFTQINKDARIIFLSATMPNVEEIASWISYGLTGKQTFILNSSFRPVPLNIHYEVYADEVKGYSIIEQEKVNYAMEIVSYYKEDKFLIFAHTKRTGELMKKELLKAKITAEFHNADLEKSDRIELENKFRNESNPRVVVATSTLAWGCNLPARRVIILGVHRGVEEVETYDITQMIGRSGRLGIDPMGDAYVLIPESEQIRYKEKLTKQTNIESQLLSKSGPYYKDLAFHLVAEIYHGFIKTTDDVYRWYERSLAHFQNKLLKDDVVKETLDILSKCGAIGQDENGDWFPRVIGKVSALFYFSPFDVSDLFFNIKFVFDNNKQDDDYYVSVALGNLDSNRSNPVVSKLEKDEMSSYKIKVLGQKTNKFLTDGSCKSSFCYFNILSCKNNITLSGMQRSIQTDFSRVSQVLYALNTFAKGFASKSWIKNLEDRVSYGVPLYLVPLCRVPNIGKARANKLYEKGIKSPKDIVNCDPSLLKQILNLKQELVNKVIEDSKSF
jgi:replicative superfamily II helicase